MKILVSYRGIPQSPGWATGDMVVRAFRALGHEVYPYANYYQTGRWVEDQKPSELLKQDYDLLLFMECNDGDPQYAELTNARARRRASWTFDNSYYPDGMERLLAYFSFDYHFLANPLYLNRFPNGYYLPYACDPKLHGRPINLSKKVRDIALVGSIREDRKQLQQELEQCGLKLELISGAFRENYIDELAASRIIINQNPDAGAGLLNMRFWECMAAGTFVTTEARDLNINAWDNDAIRLDIPPGVGWYNNLYDIMAFCKILLNIYDTTKLIEIQNFVFQHHTYANRCQTILDTVFGTEELTYLNQNLGLYD